MALASDGSARCSPRAGRPGRAAAGRLAPVRSSRSCAQAAAPRGVSGQLPIEATSLQVSSRLLGFQQTHQQPSNEYERQELANMVEREVRRLKAKWDSGSGWPKRLVWLEIDGIRGWQGQRFSLSFPIMAVVGENGTGKSTLLQAAASVYRPEDPHGGAPAASVNRFASAFFPDTPWDRIGPAEIRCAVREGDTERTPAIYKRTDRWQGNPDRRQRYVEYIDLSRIQPVPARVGYTQLANVRNTEQASTSFDEDRLARFTTILGRPYDAVRMATTSAGPSRKVPVIATRGAVYSGFHQGAGETTLVELLQKDVPKYSLVLIDEIESSLHPRMQRRLVRDLAEFCRVNEVQIVLTTHSPYVLEELPPEARAHIVLTGDDREIVYGVSPEFSMTRMDDLPHYECDLYVEDDRSATLLVEILTATEPELVRRCQVIRFGAASVGQALGQMSASHRFPGPSCVFLDGDVGPSPGCLVLPGDDAPEPVVFAGLKARDWVGISERTGRPYADVADACNRAMFEPNLHDWVSKVANALVLSGDTVWQAMCAEWSNRCLSPTDAKAVTNAISDVLLNAADSR
jgi:predicted ATPase